MADHNLLHKQFPIEVTGETTPRTVQTHDISTFAGLTGDYSRLHLDDDFGSRSPYGSRIAHGLLSASWAMGALSLEAGQTVGRRNPRSHISDFEVNFRSPVRPGDTLRCRWRSSRQEAVGTDFGTVRTDFEMIGPRDERMTDGHLMLRLPLTSDRDSPLERAPPPWPRVLFELEKGRTYYVQDLPSGSMPGYTDSRRLTEADMVAYGHFTGDYGGQASRPLDGAERAVIQPMLTFDIGFALWLRDWTRTGSAESAGNAGHLSDRWMVHRPFYVGDTLECRFKVLSSRISKSRLDAGLVTCGLQMLNQKNEVCMSSEVILMYPSRP